MLTDKVNGKTEMLTPLDRKPLKCWHKNCNKRLGKHRKLPILRCQFFVQIGVGCLYCWNISQCLTLCMVLHFSFICLISSPTAQSGGQIFTIDSLNDPNPLDVPLRVISMTKTLRRVIALNIRILEYSRGQIFESNFRTNPSPTLRTDYTNAQKRVSVRTERLDPYYKFTRSFVDKVTNSFREAVWNGWVLGCTNNGVKVIFLAL